MKEPYYKYKKYFSTRPKKERLAYLKAKRETRSRIDRIESELALKRDSL